MTKLDKITPESLRFERVLDAPVEKVWRFLIEPDLRARWFMGGPTDPREGGKIGLTMNHDRLSDDDVPVPERFRSHVGASWEERIVRIKAPHLHSFTWDEGKAGEITFELSDENGKTRLVLTHSGLRGREDAQNFGSGWHSHLAALERRIRGDGVPNFWALHKEAETAIQDALASDV
ncbi:SRPBCC family protein [Rhizorhapis sp. SPR117]|uniref:SRPBCC family protein n=1 Tax=Rhizorhapis sp. SPR117 TaxID=2912611 RepID=UPI001F1617B2|nr:SRPBCC family protein [Rhizorhapis sp. SPR117]